MGFWIFFPKIPPIFKLEVGFLSNIKSFSQIFENTPNFSCLNYVWRIFQQDQRNFFGSNKLIFIKIPLEKATDTGHFGREQVKFYPPARRISVAFPSWGPFDWLSLYFIRIWILSAETFFLFGWWMVDGGWWMVDGGWGPTFCFFKSL